jgi:hypothetical protein
MQRSTLILDYEHFQVFAREGKYYYHDFEAKTIEEVTLLAKEPIEPFSANDSDDYLLNKYPEADITGEDIYSLVYYWFILKGEN